MQIENNYIIYKAQNLENGLVYIGATTNSVAQRKLDHLERANRGESGKFQEAISTYGVDAFEWEQIDTASSTDELAQKEKQYIDEFKAKEEGYNSDEGGGFKKTVYQYNLVDGYLKNTYSCLTDAANAVNANKQCISRTCLSVNKIFRGYYWSYDYKVPFSPTTDKRRKVVHQYLVGGEFTAEYNSVAEASKITGISKSCISRVCRGEREQSGGFLWKYN
ncbi:NUMOD1 domain-containing DNA-binding protein [Lutibacter aestuarii]|uniref:NUMOD1 domain-containing DNA-binding protein n=1 Tax=Lutibacter aestuarii TaxID=861111 RepID=A0ABW2Z7I7_9FLAO